IRYGFVHMFNNFLDNWQDYGVAASQACSLFSESNVLLGAVDDEAIIIQTDSDNTTGNVRSEGGLAIGAVVVENNRDLVVPPTYPYSPARIDLDAGADGGADAAAPLLSSITANAGRQ